MREEKITLELTVNEIRNILDWFNGWAATYHRDENGNFHVPQQHKELVWLITDKERELFLEEEK